MPENKDSERSPDYNFKTPEHEAAETSDEIFFESPEAYRKFREMVKNDLEGKPGGLLDKLSEEDRLLQAARLAGTEKKIEAESTRPFIEGLKPDIEIDPELEKELNEMAQQHLKKWEKERLVETAGKSSIDVDPEYKKEVLREAEAFYKKHDSWLGEKIEEIWNGPVGDFLKIAEILTVGSISMASIGASGELMKHLFEKNPMLGEIAGVAAMLLIAPAAIGGMIKYFMWRDRHY